MVDYYVNSFNLIVKSNMCYHGLALIKTKYLITRESILKICEYVFTYLFLLWFRYMELDLLTFLGQVPQPDMLEVSFYI